MIIVLVWQSYFFVIFNFASYAGWPRYSLGWLSCQFLGGNDVC